MSPVYNCHFMCLYTLLALLLLLVSCSRLPYCEPMVSLKILAKIEKILVDNDFKYLPPFSEKLNIILA